MGVGFRNSKREQNFKAGGVGFSRKPEDQTDTLLLASGFNTRAIVKHVHRNVPLLEATSYFPPALKTSV